MNLNDIIDFSLEMEKLFLPNKVDLIIFDRFQEKALIEHINRMDIVLFEKPI